MTSARSLGLRLSEQIDLAARLRADSAVSLGELRDREAEFAQRKRLGSTPWSDADLICRWLDFVYSGKKRPGQLYVGGARLVATGVLTAGLLTGWSTAKLVLRYDGRTPVNVVEYLAVFVLLQIILLGLLLLSAAGSAVVTSRKRSAGRRPVGIVQTLLRFVLDAKSKHETAPPRTEKWLLLFLTQIFGVSFNVAALAATLYLVSFTDLAFAWSTTLDVSAEGFFRLFELLALPFGWLKEGLVPSLDVVRETQYFRFDERYAAAGVAARATDVRLLGSWWPFLVACIMTYGLIPRLILFTVAGIGLERSISNPELPELEIENLLARLRAAFHPRAGHSEGAQGDGKLGAVPETVTQLSAELPQVAVLWRDVAADEATVRRALTDSTGKEPSSILRAGGAAFDMKGERVAANLRHLHQKGRVRVLVLVEDGEHADASLTGFLRGLHEMLGPEVLLLVVPVRARSGELAIAKDAVVVDRWRRQLRQAAGDIVAVYERGAGS